jgi:uncharacterized 2Fe-2S/4Fe-4S cluster protein (DUF4445 family)
MAGPLKVVFPNLGRTLKADKGDGLLDLIREAGLAIDADCGGVGRCGKCEVIVNGECRLACMTHVMADCEVLIPTGAADDDGYVILSDHTAKTDDAGAAGAPDADNKGDDTHDEGANGTGPAASAERSYALAVDIGTTTVVGKLVELTTGLETASFAQMNSQVVYGADVLSRIDASLDDSSKLSALITRQLDDAIAAMLAEQHIGRTQVERMVIAANTTMSYILLGLPCRSLGLSPFTPAFPIEGPYPYHEVFGTDTLECPCDVLPYISAYVGGDLTAGLCTLRDEDDFILMDMGTNGELVFKRDGSLICTATAAGPAFEGGNIECGCGSTRGAISSVSYEDGRFSFKTIGAAPPVGICGSGILDLMACLLRGGFVDETGYLSSPSEDGRIVLAEASEAEGGKEVYFTQKDVRQFQLAKGAVRAGLAVLIEEMGGQPPSRVFLAGGFGQNLDPASALMTGLLPEEFDGRVIAIGNSSLGGSVKVCLNDAVRTEVVTMTATGQEINLGAHKRFNDLFMEHMLF